MTDKIQKDDEVVQKVEKRAANSSITGKTVKTAKKPEPPVLNPEIEQMKREMAELRASLITAPPSPPPEPEIQDGAVRISDGKKVTEIPKARGTIFIGGTTLGAEGKFIRNEGPNY